MSQTYYIIYGVNIEDDYLKLLNNEEFRKFDNVAKKFNPTHYKDNIGLNMFMKERLNDIYNVVLYYLPQLLEKKELVVNNCSENSDDKLFCISQMLDPRSTIESLMKNADPILNSELQYLYQLRILDVELFVWKCTITT